MNEKTRELLKNFRSTLEDVKNEVSENSEKISLLEDEIENLEGQSEEMKKLAERDEEISRKLHAMTGNLTPEEFYEWVRRHDTEIAENKNEIDEMR